STGRYAGSAWFADTFARDLDRHCVAHLNCDSPGCRWATSYEVIQCFPEALPYVQRVVKAVTGQTAKGKRPQRNSDYTFNNIGVTGLFNASSNMPPEALAEQGYYIVGGCGGNIAWHTENDTLEIADFNVLRLDAELYAAAVMGLATEAILPFDWR
ncbi:MAG: peptidase M28, partial [Pararhodobacter sp.]